MSIFDELIGKTVTGFFLSEDAEVFKFCFEGAEIHFSCEADCCSETWVNHISGVDNLIGGRIAQVIAKDDKDVPATRQEVEYAMLWTFVTNKGYFDLEVRNSSNGYYCGSVEKGLPRRDPMKCRFREIKADF